MNKLLNNIGLAVRDGVYEVFMEYTKTTDLDELKESGHEVKEFPLSPGGNTINKLYVLEKDKSIQISCSLVQISEDDVEVKLHTPIETRDLLKRIAYLKQAAERESRKADKSSKNHIRRVK